MLPVEGPEVESRRVFLSCAGEDVESASGLALQLEGSGIEIEGRLPDSADAVVVIASPAGLHSQQVRREYELALSHSKLVIPALLGISPKELPAPLEGLMSVDLVEDFDGAVRTIIAAVGAAASSFEESSGSSFESSAADPSLPSFSPPARLALTLAAAMLEPVPSVPPSRLRAAALLGALRAVPDAGIAPTMDVAALVLSRQQGRRDVNAALDAAATAAEIRPVSFPQPSPLLVEELQKSSAAFLIPDLLEIQRRTGADGVHLRHVLAVGFDESVSSAVFSELRVQREELLDVWLASIQRNPPAEGADVWIQLLRPDQATPFDLSGEYSPDRVDPTEGISLDQDHLGVGAYVTMFAALIADENTPMPLSIGLFGEWGSGKSYFMGLLRKQVAELANKDERYLKQIVQIGFNAWHYADTNLWASIGDKIFEQLAGPGETDERRRERIREKLGERLQRRRELEAASDRAKEETVRLSRRLDEASAQVEVSAKDLAEAALEARETKEAMDKAWRKLGVSDDVEKGRLLAAELHGTRQDLALVHQALRGRRKWLFVPALLGIVTACIVLVALTTGWWRPGGVLAAIVAVGAVAGCVAARARSGLQLLHQVAGKVREQQQNHVADKLQDLRRAEAEQRVLQTQLEEVTGQVRELSRELAELDPGQRLYSFIAERASSGTYRSQLGLISTIRRDFEELDSLMMEWRKERKASHANKADLPEPVERIVLYIDDLDRCSSEQVVAVLEAVHLLLALDLFVVVVGVDPRWLMRALRRQYRSMLSRDPQAPQQDPWWETTPQDYLEKIFNIPFALPRMQSDGFGQLVRSLVTIEGVDAQAPPLTGATPQVDLPRNDDPTVAGVQAEIPVEIGSEVASLQAGDDKTEMRPMTRAERDMLTALAPLLDTPRETKRLVNLYRLIRATRSLSPASTFLGSSTSPGEYQAVVVLLGLLSGHGRRLEDILAAPVDPEKDVRGGLLLRDPSQPWTDFVVDLAPALGKDGWHNAVVGALSDETVAVSWKHLANNLAEVSSLVTIPDLAPFQLWAPRVARFSFLLSPYARGRAL